MVVYVKIIILWVICLSNSEMSICFEGYWHFVQQLFAHFLALTETQDFNLISTLANQTIEYI